MLIISVSTPCRSSSTRGESWWMRSRPPKTPGSAKLWAPSKVPPLPLRPPHPCRRLHPPQRTGRPSRACFHPSVLAGCRNTSWRIKPRRNAAFRFCSWPLTRLLGLKAKDEGRGSDQRCMFYLLFRLEWLRFDLKLTAGFILSCKLVGRKLN